MADAIGFEFQIFDYNRKTYVIIQSERKNRSETEQNTREKNRNFEKKKKLKPFFGRSMRR